ncbi:HAMP domain-containing sensor histidine kinase [Erwinia sp. MMLR14_017]|uniref:sensor histidine kinase n=1 Tax=Erwinia sp. MMLR14_017 TaxID=3093842 RepID=UPI00299020E9|nr:HAMP domain-containing sensor histidine kinase [Erwinia sp. MMLR14_017]MDW8847816.1 HAMP domain-containing sensor histidine kinase [Erwinia sp. MMLR14_017]
MKKLTDLPMYQQVFLAVTGAIFVVIFSTIAIWLWMDDNNRHLSAFATFTGMIEKSLPPSSAPTPVQTDAIESWIEKTHTRFALFSPEGKLLSRKLNPPIPFPKNIKPYGYFDDWYATRFVWQLADKRVLVVQFSDDRANRPWLFIFMLLALACAVALAAWPVVRRLMARLEALQQSVESLGKGDLSSRVMITGNDEVARLAVSFNQSASQLEKLVNAQKHMLARTSHELRSPLARIQMASVWLAPYSSPAGEELRRSVAELDELVEEILTMSRLEAAQIASFQSLQSTDVTAIAAEECARASVDLAAAHIIALVDPSLIRRMMRNLIENALKHGEHPVNVTLHVSAADTFEFAVCDRGPGIPVSESNRIFEPFYRVEKQGGPEGTGLGLALVKAVSEYHGGSVVVSNPETGGVCFTVHLPYLRTTNTFDLTSAT